MIFGGMITLPYVSSAAFKSTRSVIVLGRRRTANGLLGACIVRPPEISTSAVTAVVTVWSWDSCIGINGMHHVKNRKLAK